MSDDDKFTLKNMLSLNKEYLETCDTELAIGRKLKSCFNPGSVYLNEEAMTIMNDFFHRNIKNFDYYGRNILSPKTVIKLRDNINEFKERLIVAESAEDFVGFMDDFYLNNLRRQFEERKELLISLADSLVSWLDEMIEKKKFVTMYGP